MNIRLAWHPMLQPARVEAELSRPLVRDRIGHRIHLILALAWCFCASWPTTSVETASIPILVFSAVRALNIWRVWWSITPQPLVLGTLAWVAWQATTLLWSPDVGHGLREWSANRWLLGLWVLWPVMAHRRALIVALAAGFVVGNLSQVWQVVAVPMGWPTWVRMPDRISGWWPPAMGGSMLCAALGLHLPAAVMGSGRTRVVGVVGATVTAAGLLATGTRGAWVAGAALTAVALGFGVWRWVVGRDRVGLARFAGVAVVVMLAAAVGWLVLREPITRRVALAREDIAAALERHDYRSDTGARVLMASMALRAIREHPAGGVGAGGYQAWAQSRLRAEGEPEAAALIHAHAHDAPLHIGATTGLVGLMIWGFMVVVALRGAVEGLGDAARASGGPLTRGTVRGGAWGGWGSYDAAPFFAVVGLGLVGLFDVVQLNTQTVALLGTLLAMCMVSRPPAARMPFGRGENAGEVAGPERR